MPWQWFVDVGSWCRGGDNGGGGQRAVGMVVPSLFGYFLMGLWLDICWVCGGFSVMVVVVWC